jgi:D-beta-D-heptose 7-phosphate kinase/D-beta-D-heptose 1-phosphate adenosyltransferase
MESDGRRCVVISGYMNPVHAGHCEYAKLAKEFAGGQGGVVVCVVNSDYQAELKRGFSFVPETDRLAVMGSLRWVDYAVLSVDRDRTVRRTLRVLCGEDPELSVADLVVAGSEALSSPLASHRPTHFVNGGDVDGGCAEEAVCKELGISTVYGLGDKIQSSSWILQDSVKTAYECLFETIGQDRLRGEVGGEKP